MPESHDRYQLGIDLGNSFSLASICRAGTKPEPVSLSARQVAAPSVILPRADGSWVMGEDALSEARDRHDDLITDFITRVGDETPIGVGAQAMSAAAIAANFVVWMIDQVTGHEGKLASRVAIAHPAHWGPTERDAIKNALGVAGIHQVELVTAPHAIAQSFARSQCLEPGFLFGIYDFGGSSFEAAIARVSDDGGAEILGRPVYRENLGGNRLDARVFGHVKHMTGEALGALNPADPTTWTAVAALEHSCTAAKEELSSRNEVTIPVRLPNLEADIDLSRAVFDDLIRGTVLETIDALREALDQVDVRESTPLSVLLVGGSSRVPLVAELVSSELGDSVYMEAAPKLLAANGAALLATDAMAGGAAPAGEFPALGAADPVGGGQSGRRHSQRRVAIAGAALAAAAAVVAAGFAVPAIGSMISPSTRNTHPFGSDASWPGFSTTILPDRHPSQSAPQPGNPPAPQPGNPVPAGPFLPSAPAPNAPPVQTITAADSNLDNSNSRSNDNDNSTDGDHNSDNDNNDNNDSDNDNNGSGNGGSNNNGNGSDDQRRQMRDELARLQQRSSKQQTEPKQHEPEQQQQDSSDQHTEGSDQHDEGSDQGGKGSDQGGKGSDQDSSKAKSGRSGHSDTGKSHQSGNGGNHGSRH